MTKKTFFVCLLFFANSWVNSWAHAAHTYTDHDSSIHSIYGALGFTEGGFALGADYEYSGHKDFGLGGYLRIYQKDDTDFVKEGITTLGAFLRTHLNKAPWDLYFSPGFGVINVDSTRNNPGDTTSLGPSLAIGLLYQLNNKVELGVENMRTWIWFDSTWHGLRVDDLLFKIRVSL